LLGDIRLSKGRIIAVVVVVVVLIVAAHDGLVEKMLRMLRRRRRTTTRLWEVPVAGSFSLILSDQQGTDRNLKGQNSQYFYN
jgi:hypothetical protein